MKTADGGVDGLRREPPHDALTTSSGDVRA